MDPILEAQGLQRHNTVPPLVNPVIHRERTAVGKLEHSSAIEAAKN